MRVKPDRERVVSSPFPFRFSGFCFDLAGPKRKPSTCSAGMGRGSMVEPPGPEAAVSEQQLNGSWWHRWGTGF